jgi:hypothetical protein
VRGACERASESSRMCLANTANLLIGNMHFFYGDACIPSLWMRHAPRWCARNKTRCVVQQIITRTPAPCLILRRCRCITVIEW